MLLWQAANRELKQTDAAAEMRRSTRKFYSGGLKAKWIQSAPDIIHSLIWKEIWVWPPPLGRRVSLLKFPNINVRLLFVFLICFNYIIWVIKAKQAFFSTSNLNCHGFDGEKAAIFYLTS